ncbi:ATP-binding protein [Streptomyces thermovulgaris]|uniref:ATP-binding protein n=1 Tax=Streptomyces TaxID=1883 RepID=UPI00082BEEAA
MPDVSIDTLGPRSSVSAAGLAVELRVDGEVNGPPVVRAVAHRVVQEALTNVAKHAPGATVTVHVTHTAAETRIVVENGPPLPTANLQPGFEAAFLARPSSVWSVATHRRSEGRICPWNWWAGA